MKQLKKLYLEELKYFHKTVTKIFLNNIIDIKKYKSELVIITGDFFLYSDTQTAKEEKDWLYPQMIKAITKIKDSIVIIVFSPIKISGLINYIKI